MERLTNRPLSSTPSEQIRFYAGGLSKFLARKMREIQFSKDILRSTYRGTYLLSHSQETR